MEELEKRFFPLMVDPSVFLSADHLKKLIDAEYKLYISRTLFNILSTLDKKYITFILSYFYWPSQKKLIKLDIETIRGFLKKDSMYEIYTAPEEDIIKLRPYLSYEVQKFTIPLEVQQILIDELSFLIRSSSLLLRFRRTLDYFRRAGIIIIDLANTAKDKKERIFHKIKNLKWFITILLTGLSMTNLESLDPIFHLLQSGASFILVVMDD